MGIGTTNPTYKLHVAGASYLSGGIQLDSTNRIKFGNGNQYITGVNSTSLTLVTGGSASLTVLDNGNTGIGTTSPSTKLHLSGADNEAVVRLQNSSTGLTEGDVIGSLEFYKSDASGAGVGVSGSLKAVSGNDTGAETDLIFGTSSTARGNNAETMRLTGEGSVGIGTDSPTSILEVRGDGGNNKQLRLSTGATTYWDLGRSSANGNFEITEDSGDTYFTIDKTSGKVGIGTDSPSDELTIRGAQFATTTLSIGDNTDRFRIGYLHASGLSSGLAAAQLGSDAYSDLSIAAPSNGASEIKFFTNTASGTPSEALRIDSSQRVGIGTTSPQELLHLEATEPLIRFDDTNSGLHYILGQDGDGFKFTTNNSTYGKYTFDSNVGIGTSSPSEKLHVVGGNIKTDPSTRQIGYWEADAVHDGYFVPYNASGQSELVNSFATGALLFKTGTSKAERMRLDASGNLLVGKTAASSYTAGFQAGQDGFTAITRASAQPLVVNRLTNDGTIIDIRKDSATVGTIASKDGDITIGTGDTGLRFNDAYDAIYGANSTTQVGRDASIDLGMSSQRFKDLHLSGAAYTGGQLKGSAGSTTKTIINATSTTTELHAAGTTGIVFKNNGDSEKMRLDGSGRLLVGTTSDGGDGISLRPRASGTSTTSQIRFNRADTTNSGIALLFMNNTQAVGQISHTNTATTYATSSDARLKDVTGEARGLEVITKLNPVAYNWKADGKADEGLIAQEVKELVPNAVTGSEDEHYQMDYSKLVTHLVKGMKEQQEQIEFLKKEIANLKGE